MGSSWSRSSRVAVPHAQVSATDDENYADGLSHKLLPSHHTSAPMRGLRVPSMTRASSMSSHQIHGLLQGRVRTSTSISHVGGLAETADVRLLRIPRMPQARGLGAERLFTRPTRMINVTIVEYYPGDIRTREIRTEAQLTRFLAALAEDLAVPEIPAADGGQSVPGHLRWIQVDHGDEATLQLMGDTLGLHAMALEDCRQVPQRPKLEEYANYLFVVLRVLRHDQRHLLSDTQLSLFLCSHHILLSVHDPQGCPLYEQVLARLSKPSSQALGQCDLSFVLYFILDAIVNAAFPVLEQFGDRLEELEEGILADPQPKTVQLVHLIKRQLLLLRKVMFPTREVLTGLQHNALWVTPEARNFVRTCSDHAMQIIDIIETCTY